MKFFSLKEKKILITGASSGIGQQTAIECSKNGAILYLLDKDKAGLENTYKHLKGEGHFIQFCDLTDFANIKKIVELGVKKIGKFSGFVHCAGIEYTLPVINTKVEHYRSLFDINVISGFEIAKYLTKKKYRDENHSSFVFIASIMSLVGRKGLTGYSASKGALVAGIRSMSLELASKNINVNCISPGTVRTKLIDEYLQKLSDEQRKQRMMGFPLGLGKPEDVANAVIFLLSDKAKWITGTNLVIDGGFTAQ